MSAEKQSRPGVTEAARLAHEALTHATPEVFWTDRPDRPEPADALVGATSADLVVVGGGFTGLWAAIVAAERDPGRRIIVCEARGCGFGASTRNGGFCDASLTHGLANGIAHWPDEIDTLERLGRENVAALARSLHDHGVDADYHAVEELGVATQPWHLDELEAAHAQHRSRGDDVELLSAAQARARVESPTYLGALVRRDGVALVDPARLTWGLRDVAERLGVVVHERSPVEAVDEHADAVHVRTPKGSVRADRVVVATNAWARPARGARRYVVPVYDYVLVTEPLSNAQGAALGWARGEGVVDVSNQFHYYRPTADGRILWGGYDAVYHYASRIDDALDQRDETHTMLATHFFETFPQLEDVRFSHRWGGPIATSTRFTAAWVRSRRRRVVWVGGYTGLGVGASRFGASVALDLVDGLETERTELAMVRRRPMPFPPEPLRWLGVAATRRAIGRADERGGRRGLWLRALDRVGIGFDS